MNDQSLTIQRQKLFTNLDDTLITVFRLFIAIRLTLTLLRTVTQTGLAGVGIYGRGFSIAEMIVLLAYLSTPALRERLGRFYLPIALAWASIVPILVQNYASVRFFNDTKRDVMTDILPLDLITTDTTTVLTLIVVVSATQTILGLIGPVVAIGWRYNMQAVMWFCVITALLDVLLTIALLPLQRDHIAILITLTISRNLIFLMIGWLVRQLVNSHVRQHHDLVRANQKLQHYAITREQLAVSQERNRLARELHDTMAHTLAASAVQLEAINLIWEQQPDKARELVQQATVSMRDGLEDTRRALQSLRATPLESMGLGNAVTVLADSISDRHSLHVETHITNGDFALSASQEHTIYRIIQEALNNIVRHAKATTASVSIQDAETGVMVNIHDDGVGFDITAPHPNGRYGLQGMRERAAQIQADLNIVSAPGQGTRVTLFVET